MAKGKLIVIDGTDGSGKTDQTKLLVSRLLSEGFKVKEESFPTYGRLSAKGVELYLNGTLGTADDIGPYYGSMFYAYNRARETGPMRDALKYGTHCVLNRYVSANGGHQGGKIHDDNERKQYLDWLFDLEFNRFKIPVPDLNILLHMPPAIGHVLVGRKAPEQRTYLTEGKKKDIHEADLQHLLDAEQAYLYLARNYPGWVTVSCVKPEIEGNLDVINNWGILPEEKIKTPQQIREEVYSHAIRILSP
jgi:dTMP kinase